MSAGGVAIIGTGESPYTRHPQLEFQGHQHRTEHVLAEAVVNALADAGVDRDEVDGLGVCSFNLPPDNAIDLVWRLGMTVDWLMEDKVGGACGVNMLQHAVRAIEGGDASTIVLVAGDKVFNRGYESLNDNYSRAAQEYLAPLPFEGPNTLFSFITQRHMREHGLEREDYGCIPLAQRWWAQRNPSAVYRTPLTLDDYLNAPMVAPPLRRYDCVMPLTGANAIVVSAERRSDGPVARVLATGACFNWDKQEGDGTSTGLSDIAAPTYERAGVGPDDIDVTAVYDDYPVIVLIQLAELGLIGDGDLKRFLHEELLEGHLPVNTSGGQLSCGQAGAAGGIMGLAEIATQLLGRAGERQVENARTGVCTGYGMVLFRYCGSSNMAVLARED